MNCSAKLDCKRCDFSEQSWIQENTKIYTISEHEMISEEDHMV